MSGTHKDRRVIRILYVSVREPAGQTYLLEEQQGRCKGRVEISRSDHRIPPCFHRSIPQLTPPFSLPFFRPLSDVAVQSRLCWGTQTWGRVARLPTSLDNGEDISAHCQPAERSSQSRFGIERARAAFLPLRDWKNRDPLALSCVWLVKRSFLCLKNGEVAVVSCADLV